MSDGDGRWCAVPVLKLNVRLPLSPNAPPFRVGPNRNNSVRNHMMIRTYTNKLFIYIIVYWTSGIVFANVTGTYPYTFDTLQLPVFYQRRPADYCGAKKDTSTHPNGCVNPQCEVFSLSSASAVGISCSCERGRYIYPSTSPACINKLFVIVIWELDWLVIDRSKKCYGTPHLHARAATSIGRTSTRSKLQYGDHSSLPERVILLSSFSWPNDSNYCTVPSRTWRACFWSTLRGSSWLNWLGCARPLCQSYHRC